MSKRKYKQGKQINTIADFDQCESKWYMVRFGSNLKTVHRSFLMSWQYRTLLGFIQRGLVFSACKQQTEGEGRAEQTEPQTDCRRCKFYVTETCRDCRGGERFEDSGYVTETEGEE